MEEHKLTVLLVVIHMKHILKAFKWINKTFLRHSKIETTTRGIRLQSGLTSGNGISNMLQLDNDGNSNGDGSKITFSRAGMIRTEIEALKNETSNNETDIVFRTTNLGSIGEKLLYPINWRY